MIFLEALGSSLATGGGRHVATLNPQDLPLERLESAIQCRDASYREVEGELLVDISLGHAIRLAYLD